MDKINEERIKQLLVKHLMNDLDSSEAREIDEWRKQSPSNDSLFLRMSDSSYLAKRYRDFAQVVVLETTRMAEKKSRLRYWLWGCLAVAAAAAVLLFVIPYAMKPKMLTFSSPNKDIASLVLPDGSKVWMKAASTITYPEKFKGDSRDISFTGEGYFEVIPSGDPFVVQADGFKVKVTGTKFDLKSYRDENKALTALIDGEIFIIYADSSGVQREEKMVGGDLSVFDKSSRSNNIVKANTSIYSSWIGGVYYFESETVENILREVCRYYGFNLIIDEKVIKDKILSGRLKMSESADSIIVAFQEYFPGHISFESNTIIIQ